MNRLILLATLLALLPALPAWSQDEPRKDEPVQEDKPVEAAREEDPDEPEEKMAETPPAEPGGSTSVAFAWWFSDFDLNYRTATATFSFEDPAVEGVEISERLDFTPEWALRAALEIESGLEKDILGLNLGMVYRPDLLPRPFDLSVRASAVLVRLEMDSVPGDFDPTIGAEGSVRLGYALTPISNSLDIHVELGGRFVEFEFDPDAGVTTTDDTLGGFGGRLLAGVSLSF